MGKKRGSGDVLEGNAKVSESAVLWDSLPEKSARFIYRIKAHYFLSHHWPECRRS